MDIKYTRTDINDFTHELEITIPTKNFKHSYDLMLKDYSKDLDIKGFRKGKVPTDLVTPEIKEIVKYETFEKLVPMYVNTALAKEKLNPIAPPELKEIPKFLEDLDISFTVTVTSMPSFKLGDMKKVKVQKEKVTIDQKDIESAIEELKSSQKTEEKEINDKWAKEIGKVIGEDGIETLEQLKKKIKEALTIQKEHYQMHQLQDEALRLAIKQSKIEIPQAAVEYEARERENSFNDDIKSKDIKIEDFLKANSITIEKMRELWQLDSKEAIESDVFLTIYSAARDIKAEPKEVEEKIDGIKAQQPDADPSIFSNVEWRAYIERVVTKEKAFRQFIEEVLGKEFLDEHN